MDTFIGTEIIIIKINNPSINVMSMIYQRCYAN